MLELPQALIGDPLQKYIRGRTKRADLLLHLIVSPHKGLNKRDYLIDDRDSGQEQDKFEGQLIQFGSEAFPDWERVREFLKSSLAAEFSRRMSSREPN